MFSKGADVDAVRDSAGRMASYGNEIDVVRERGQRAVSTMQRFWQGPDLQHLVERWRRVEHDLVRISADFDRLSRRLHDNADLQHRSSGHPGHSSGHSGGGGRGGHVTAHLGAPVGASFVAAAGTPQAHTATGWAVWIGLGQPFGLQPGVPANAFHTVPSAAVAAAAAHQLGLPIR